MYSVDATTSGKEEPLDGNVTFGHHPLPGGNWRCEISGLAAAGVSFRGAGPTGRLMYASACDGANVMTTLKSIHPCSTDEGGKPFHSLRSVTCSAVLTGVNGKTVRLEVVFDGKFMAGTVQSRGYTKEGSRQMTGSVVSVNQTLTAEEMTLGAGPLPPGTYACRWLVDGTEVGRRPFTVGA